MILRSLLCSSALLIAAPAMAQDMQAQPQTTAPTPDPQVTPEAATPAAPATATPQAPAAPASPDSSTTTAQSAPADSAQPAQGQAASGAQIAAIVNSEFPTYDADKSGDLSETEFAAWMTALKKQDMKENLERCRYQTDRIYVNFSAMERWLVLKNIKKRP